MTAPLVPGVSSARRRLAWTVAPGALVAIACAVSLFATMRALGGPLWLAVAAALTVFPVLPLVWHLAAERQRGRVGPGAPLERLALRSVALGLLVVLISLGNLGPRRVGESLQRLVRRDGTAARPNLQPGTPPGAPVVAPSRARRHELESFIPADANLVVALSDSALRQRLLPAQAADLNKRLAAFEKCQIALDRARILIAARDRDTRLVVVRAPGITDQRNLYCLAGFLGTDRFSIRVLGDPTPLRFEVGGLLPQWVKFEAVDEQTIVATQGAWAGAATKKLYPDGGDKAMGPLGAALERVDRGASLWSAGLARIDKGGSWDMALDARVDGTHFELRGSSVPPSGVSDRAELQMRVPLSFASSLPAGALQDGLRGAAAALSSFMRP